MPDIETAARSAAPDVDSARRIDEPVAVTDDVPAPLAALPAVGAMPVPGLVRGAPLRRLASGDDPLGGTAAPAGVLEVLRRRSGGGSALPGSVAGAMGEQFGADLSAVRVHHDAEANGVASAVQSVAFTHGRDIYFSRGAYDPGSQAGRRLLAHELAHVTAGERGGGATMIGRADDPAERAADRTADRVVGALRRSTSSSATAAGQLGTQPVFGDGAGGRLRRVTGVAPAQSQGQKRAARRARARERISAAKQAGVAGALQQAVAPEPVAAQPEAAEPAAQQQEVPKRTAAQRRAANRRAAKQKATTLAAEPAVPEPTAEEQWLAALPDDRRQAAKKLLSGAKPWTTEQVAGVIQTAPKAGVVPLLQTFDLMGLTAVEAGVLVNDCSVDVMQAVTSSVALRTQMNAAKAQWGGMSELPAVLNGFYSKVQAPAELAEFLKITVVRQWTRGNAQKLIDGLKTDALRDVTGTPDLHRAVNGIGSKWTNWAELAAVVDLAHDKGMAAADKVAFLDECSAQFQPGKRYTTANAKAYIATAALATDYSWADRLEQVKLFRNHVQPASSTNEVTGPSTDVCRYEVTEINPDADAPDKRIAQIRLPEGKVTHVKDGHTYANYYFSVLNCRRSTYSSMLKPGVDVAALVGNAARNSQTPQIDNAARNRPGDPGGTQDKTSNTNYVISYRHIGVISAPVKKKDAVKYQPKIDYQPAVRSPRRRGRRGRIITPEVQAQDEVLAQDAADAVPGVYGVAVSQYYPADGADLAHKLHKHLAEAIGRLRGYIG